MRVSINLGITLGGIQAVLAGFNHAVAYMPIPNARQAAHFYIERVATFPFWHLFEQTYLNIVGSIDFTSATFSSYLKATGLGSANWLVVGFLLGLVVDLLSAGKK